MHVTIVYDGQCPVCRRLVQASRLRERSAELDFMDARQQKPTDIQGHDLSHLDLDEGFCVVVDGTIHHGAEAARVLALLTESTGIGFRLFQFLMRTRKRSSFWYPILKSCRALLLRLIRVPRFSDSA